MQTRRPSRKQALDRRPRSCLSLPVTGGAAVVKSRLDWTGRHCQQSVEVLGPQYSAVHFSLTQPYTSSLRRQTTKVATPFFATAGKNPVQNFLETVIDPYS